MGVHHPPNNQDAGEKRALVASEFPISKAEVRMFLSQRIRLLGVGLGSSRPPRRFFLGEQQSGNGEKNVKPEGRRRKQKNTTEESFTLLLLYTAMYHRIKFSWNANAKNHCQYVMMMEISQTAYTTLLNSTVCRCFET